LTPPESDELELLAGKFDLSKNDFEEPSRPTTRNLPEVEK